jgi:hypothetical protein
MLRFTDVMYSLNPTIEAVKFAEALRHELPIATDQLALAKSFSRGA